MASGLFIRWPAESSPETSFRSETTGRDTIQKIPTEFVIFSRSSDMVEK